MSPCVHYENVIVCSPTLDSQTIRAGDCPDCGKRTRFICFHYPYYGTDSTCLRCGRHWSDGEWMPLPFERAARRNSIERAKRAWRRHREEARAT